MGESREGWMTALRGAVGRHLFEVMFLTEDNKRANMSFLKNRDVIDIECCINCRYTT